MLNETKQKQNIYSALKTGPTVSLIYRTEL